MKKIISIYIVLFLIISCNDNSAEKEVLKIEVNVTDTLDSKKFKYITGNGIKGKYYSVSIDLLNNTDTVIGIIAMNCTWQENWISNNRALDLLREIECIHNFPSIMEIKPKQKRIFEGSIWVNDPTEISNNKDLKLGFVFIRKQEVSYFIEFKDVLKNKLKNKKDIIWSDALIFPR